jgi:hypothetical protein
LICGDYNNVKLCRTAVLAQNIIDTQFAKSTVV